ncbi:MAG: DUF418 domain-containing protein [Verrucomicrobiota bacterium]|nr:DUF418 domain-containing protein [Verrucomicrobiota bacterium]
MTRPDPRPALALTPVFGQERYEFLDVLRGFALFGIISANMILYSLYLALPDSAKVTMSTHATDKVLDFLELTFIEGKFYTIFSVLFGIGFSILLTRAQARSAGFYPFFLRRMFFLFLIGAAHAVFFFHDDILESYALCGVLLLPFIKVQNRTLIVAALLALVAGAVIKFTGAIPRDSFTGPRELLFQHYGFTRATRVEIWSQGSLFDVLRLNIASWFSQVDYVISSGMIFKIYGSFLLGFYLGRNEIHKKLEQYRPTIRRVALLGLVLGLPLNLIYAATFAADDSWVRNLSEPLAILPLSAGYASLLCLLWLGHRRDWLLRVFAPVGRMALTNYVGQSVICALIFYGPGLGLGGTIGPTLYLPIGLAVYLLQIAFSRFWLDRFQFGPLEWLWRMLTYGRSFPLTKRATA